MTSPEEDQLDASRREEERRLVMPDGEPVVVRPVTLTVTDEEAEMLGRGVMPESVLQRAARQAAEDTAITHMEENL